MKKKEANPFRIGRERWSSNLLAPIDWRQKRSASFAVFTSITPVASAERTKKTQKIQSLPSPARTVGAIIWPVTNENKCNQGYLAASS